MSPGGDIGSVMLFRPRFTCVSLRNHTGSVESEEIKIALSVVLICTEQMPTIYFTRTCCLFKIFFAFCLNVFCRWIHGVHVTDIHS